MSLIHNQSLKLYNTFGLEVFAEHFFMIQTIEQLKGSLSNTTIRPFNILGGGSNILLTNNLKGLTLKNHLKGIRIISETKEDVYVEVAGGENWHEFVLWALKHNFGGVENLSLIPGTIGAAPIQNIGAYGVELKDVFEEVEFYHLEGGEKVIFKKEECQFGYRNSIFKTELKGKIFISKVVLKLTKKHQLNYSYGAIQKTLEEQKIIQPTIQDISKAIIKIRQSKLPDPAKIGNAGSFFKNPEIEIEHFQELQKSFPNIVSFALPNNKLKIPAGWLIEKAGWKGKRFGNVGCHKNQALVLVNYGGGKGSEIKELATKIQASVFQKFKIQLDTEVNIW